MRRGRFEHPAWLLLPLGLTCAVYSQSLAGEFVFDDLPMIKRVQEAARTGVWFAGGALNRPIAELSFALDHRIGGPDVRVFRATNVLLHLLTVWLVYWLSRTVLARVGRPEGTGLSLAVAGAFALHPLQTQAVTYVVQRAEVASSALYVASLLFLLASERENPLSRRAGLYALACTSFAGSLLTKQIAVTLPFAYLLVAVFLRPPEDDFRRWSRVALARVVPILALDALFVWLNLSATRGTPDAGFEVPNLSAGRYFLTQLAVLPTYVRLVFWPVGQNLDWDVPVRTSLFDPRTLGGLAFVTLALGGAGLTLLGRRSTQRPDRHTKSRLIAFGVAWFLVLLVPTSSVFPLVDVMVEHRLYLALWGLLLATAVIGEAAIRRIGHESVSRVAAPVIVAFCWTALLIATYRRNEVWRSAISLWTDVVTKSPTKGRGHSNLGVALQSAGKLPEALQEYLLALKYGGRRAKTLENLGGVWLALGRVPEATATLEEAAKLDSASPGILSNLAICRLEAGDLNAAGELARRAVESDPGHGPAHATMGNVHFAAGDMAAALASFRRAREIEPGNPALAFNVALTQSRLGPVDAACREWALYFRLAGSRPRPDAVGFARSLECRLTGDSQPDDLLANPPPRPPENSR